MNEYSSTLTQKDPSKHESVVLSLSGTKCVKKYNMFAVLSKYELVMATR